MKGQELLFLSFRFSNPIFSIPLAFSESILADLRIGHHAHCRPHFANIVEHHFSIYEYAFGLHFLQRLVIEQGLDVGFAFDGDADRCIAVDERGQVVDGDRILYLYAAFLQKQGLLGAGHVVTTIMSNMGLYRALDALGIGYEQTDVGDKYVYERIQQRGDPLGGEQSGHIIFAKYATTGDGLLTAIKVMQAMLAQKRPLSELHAGMVSYPQVLINVRVADKAAAAAHPQVVAALEAARAGLGTQGRILLRKSGTEPVLRVMCEAEDGDMAQRAADSVAAALRGSGMAVEG